MDFSCKHPPTRIIWRLDNGAVAMRPFEEGLADFPGSFTVCDYCWVHMLDSMMGRRAR